MRLAFRVTQGEDTGLAFHHIGAIPAHTVLHGVTLVSESVLEFLADLRLVGLGVLVGQRLSPIDSGFHESIILWV